MVEAFLGKKYKLESSVNWDDFLKAIGVGLVTRKLLSAMTPVIELSKEGDQYVITTKTSLKTMKEKFQVGVQFDTDAPDGRKVKSTITVEGNVFHEVQVAEDGKKILIERNFSEDHIKIVMNYDNKITATRVYKLQV